MRGNLRRNLRTTARLQGSTLDSFQLLDGHSTEWRVDLPPGRYELDVYAEVRTDEGRKVFTMGDFGLVVDDALSPQIRPVDLPPCT